MKSTKGVFRRVLTNVAALVAFAMLAGIFFQSFLPEGMRPTDWLKNTYKVQQVMDGAQTSTSSDELQPAAKVSAVSFAGVQTLATTQGVSKSITASVQPASALNKEVDWSLSWQGEGVTEDISDYLTLTPTYDGALTATVTCKKSFRGKEAVATVTTRDGGFTASCYISYAGEPSAISVNDGDTGEGYLGTTTSFSVELTNVFGDVGEEFYDELTVDGITFGGTCTTTTKWVTYDGRNAGTVYYSEDDIKTNVAVTSLKYKGGTAFTDSFDVLLAGKSLVITAPSLDDAYSSKSDNGLQYIYYDHFYGDWNGYADIVLSCGEYDFSATFRVNFILGVEGVNVTPSVQF